MNVVREYYETQYGQTQLSDDEQWNTFAKIAPLWKETKSPMRVLDLGCGAGAVSEVFVKQGHEVYGLDILSEAVSRAQKKGVHAQQWNLNEGLPPFAEPFDCMLALDVLEHVFDPLRLLRQMGDALADNGYVIAALPLHFDIRQRLYTLLGRRIVSYEHKCYSSDYQAWNYFHIRFFTLDEVRQMIQLAGFQTEQQRFRPLFIYDLPGWMKKLYHPRLSWHLAQRLPRLFATGITLRLCRA